MDSASKASFTHLADAKRNLCRIKKIKMILTRPSFIVLLFLLAYTAAKLSTANYNPAAFLYIGRTFLDRAPQSPITNYVIANLGIPPNEVGYDGQMYYYIALDPLNAWRNLDTSARYDRILFPLTAKIVALDIPFLIPYSMIIINILSIVVGTEIIARMLKSKGLNPWFSLVYGLYIGQLFVISRDCIEAFSYMFVLLGIYAFETRRRTNESALFFALALFAKETAVLFVAGYIISILFRKALTLGSKLKFLIITTVPYGLFQMILYSFFGFIPILTVGGPTSTKWIPFYGVFEANHGLPELLNISFLIIIPSIISLAIFVTQILKNNREGFLYSLFFNVLFMMFLPTPSYWNVQDYARISIGLVASYLACSIFSGKKTMLLISLCWILPFTTYFTHG
jgi:hypothetical protein